MIPVNFQRRLGVHNMNLNGITIEAKVVKMKELVEDGIRELRNNLDPNFPVVGFDLKCTTKLLGRGMQSTIPELLVLYVKDRCLLVQLNHRQFRDSVYSFLSDESICFLGLQVSRKRDLLPNKSAGFSDTDYFDVLKTGVDIGTFTAIALNNRQLEGCIDLVELAIKAGFPVQEERSLTTASQCPVEPAWGALCFTQEEVKYALKDAYLSYRIGVKLTSALKID